MKNQTLSIEQMQHLQKIGVDTSNASMVLIATDNEGYDLDWEEALEYVKLLLQEIIAYGILLFIGKYIIFYT